MASNATHSNVKFNMFRHHGPNCPFYRIQRQGGSYLKPQLLRYPGARSFSRCGGQQAEAGAFSPESGFWRSGLPDNETMANGKWAGKGRSFVWSQVIETFTHAPTPSKSKNPFPGAPHGWPGHVHRGPQASAHSHKHRHGHAGSKQGGRWGRGTGSGPFNHQHFEDDRYARYFHSRNVRHHPHHRSKHHAAVEWIKHYDGRMRMKSGLFFFLAQNSPSPPPSYKQTSFAARPNPFIPSAEDPSAPTTTTAPAHAFLPSHPHSFAARPSLFSSSPLSLKVPAFPASTRTFCSSAPKSSPCHPVLEAGIPLLMAPLVTVLKSTAALNVIAIVSRIALTVLPLSLRAKVMYTVRKRYAEDPLAAPAWVKMAIKCIGEATTTQGNAMRLNAVFLAPLLALLPAILLGVIVVASFERTPVTGRLRVMMLSPTEEADLVANILAVGEQASSTANNSRDWAAILQSVLELPDEGVSPTTGRRLLLGGEVLDDRDWRFRWTQAVLRTLERGVPVLSHEEQLLDSPTATAAGSSEPLLRPPPTRYPLLPRPTMQSSHDLGWLGTTYLSKHMDGALPGHDVGVEYDLLVIERAESNAFSFGFGPEDHVNSGKRRGVVVVYTGFIDEILGNAPTASPPPPSSPAQSGIFSNFFRPSLVDALPHSVPTVLPTPEQTKALAVLLSHELAHLVLSHTLESYASTSLLIPHLSKMLSDVVRTLTFPITAVLGPFVSDAIGRSLNEGASGGFGCVGQVVNSLLSHSGIDPRFALDFWQDRLSSSPDTSTAPASSTIPPPTSSAHLHRHSTPSGDPAVGFLRSHPVDEERVELIRTELGKWLAFQGSVFA